MAIRFTASIIVTVEENKNGGHGPVFGDRAPRFAETALSFLRGEWGT